MADVMIVDDEALVLLDLTVTIEEMGHDVVCDSTNIEDAFACMEQGLPDVALLDIDVGGTLVWPLAREVKNRGCPIIFISANRNHQELRGEFADSRYIDKPASPSDISSALDCALSASNRRQSA